MRNEGNKRNANNFSFIAGLDRLQLVQLSIIYRLDDRKKSFYSYSKVTSLVAWGTIQIVDDSPREGNVNVNAVCPPQSVQPTQQIQVRTEPGPRSTRFQLSLLAMRAVVLSFALSASLALAQPQDPDRLLNAAIEAQQHGDYETAIADYRKILELRPNLFEAKVNLGAALAHEGKFDDAIAAYRSALTSAPQNRPLLLNLGLAYYKKGDFKSAREQFASLQKLQPSDVRTAILLGDSELRLGDNKAALALLEPLETANTQNLDFEYVLGSALIKAGRQRDGVERMEKVAAGTNSADAYLLAGVTLSQLNEYERARHDLDLALNLDPKLPGIYTLVGTARDKTGDAKQAEPAFRKAIELNPEDFDANLYLGAILYKNRQMDEAKTFLEHALKLNPTSSLARYEYAMYKSTAGDYPSAVQDLEKLAHDDPTWLEPHVELASLYYRLHRPADGAKERQIVDRITAEQQSQGPHSRGSSPQ